MASPTAESPNGANCALTTEKGVSLRSTVALPVGSLDPVQSRATPKSTESMVERPEMCPFETALPVIAYVDQHGGRIEAQRPVPGGNPSGTALEASAWWNMSPVGIHRSVQQQERGWTQAQRQPGFL